MSTTLNWQSQGWSYYETIEASMDAALAAAEQSTQAVLPTIFQTKAGDYTFGLTGWDVFRATIQEWPPVMLWHRGAWRVSLCSLPWENGQTVKKL